MVYWVYDLFSGEAIDHQLPLISLMINHSAEVTPGQ